MIVAILTTAQARNLHIRFTPWFEIQPMPLKNGTWFITRDTALALKEFMIDSVEENPNYKQRALQVWNFLDGLPRYELDDYPQFVYNTSIDPDNSTVEEQAELDEYTARFEDLEFENIT
jgi:hypothetical protein